MGFCGQSAGDTTEGPRAGRRGFRNVMWAGEASNVGDEGGRHVIEERVRELAAEVGVEVPPVRVSGDDPVLPSVFRVGTAAAVAVGADRKSVV